MAGRIIKKGRVQIAEAGVPAPAASARPASDEKPAEITLHKDGDVIRAIELTCACGRTTVIECEYPEEPAS